MNKELFARLRELNLPPGKYAVFGSGQLGIRNLKECHDLDVIVAEDLWNEYRYKSDWKLLKMHHGSEFLERNGIELWKDWKPGQWNIEDLIQRAEIIDDLPFVTIDDVLKWKKLSGREKDLTDIKTLNNYLNVR